MPILKKYRLHLTSFLLSTGIFLYWNNVSKYPGNRDEPYIQKYLNKLDQAGREQLAKNYADLTYSDQLVLLESIQKLVQAHNPVGRGIPEGQDRGAKSMYHFRSGLCYDRSFLLEQICSQLQIPTRHISLFIQPSGKSTLATLLSKGVRSHAATEAYTRAGWLIVEPDSPWLGLDNQGKPTSFQGLKKRVAEPNWLESPPSSTQVFYQGDSIIAVYGLFSRHGRFFSPYLPFPDLRWQEVWYNF